MKCRIIPTVFSHNKREFYERLSKLTKIANSLQIDIMDGKFVPAKSVSLQQIPSLKKYRNSFEAHLMVKNPSKYIKSLKNKGFKKIIFHINADDNVKVIAEARKNKMKVFLALNPEDKIEESCYLFQLVDGILLMGVHPGREHQKLINSTFSKVREIRKIDDKLDIQIDGGVNPSNASRLYVSGANILNTGSFVSDSENPKKALAELKRIAK